MKAEETKKMIKKAVKATQKVTTRNAEPKKVLKPSDDRTSKTKKLPSIKPAVKTEKKAPEKKAATIKPDVRITPKARVSKVAPVKSKPVVKTEKKAPKNKAAMIKPEVRITPKAKVSKVAPVKSKPAVKTEKKAPKKKAAMIKPEVKITPEARVSKVAPVKSKPVQKAAIKKAPKPAGVEATRTVSSEKKAIETKREPALPLKPSLMSGAAAEKYDTREEPKSKAERYLAKDTGARLKIFLPAQDLTKEEAEEIFFGGLPEEYGENSVIALVVDPNTVFVDWEVIPKDISDKEGSLNLRFYDITGIEFNDWNVHSVLDVLINKRVGNGFFDIRWSGRDVVVALGIFDAVSGFMPIVWSDMISFPELLSFDELGIVQKLFESGIPVGY